MKLSEQLKLKIESDLNLEIREGPFRIYGVKGAAHRWYIRLKDGRELSCEDTMRDSVKTEKLHILIDGIHPYISVS